MTPEEFNRMYLCDFTPSEKDKRLYELAKYYHETCESYDRIICTGSIRPMNSFEFADINKHALQVKQYCIRKGQSDGLTKKEVRKAISDYSK